MFSIIYRQLGDPARNTTIACKILDPIEEPSPSDDAPDTHQNLSNPLYCDLQITTTDKELYSKLANTRMDFTSAHETSNVYEQMSVETETSLQTTNTCHGYFPDGVYAEINDRSI